MNNWLISIRKLNSVVSLRIGANIGAAGASLVVEKTQMNGETILFGAVRTNKILAVPVANINWLMDNRGHA